MNAPIVNWTPTPDFLKACAVCQWCDRRSRPIPVSADGRPFFLGVGGQGWRESPYPLSHQHDDGSRGSTYTCPECAELSDTRSAAGLRPLLTPTAARVEAARRSFVAADAAHVSDENTPIVRANVKFGAEQDIWGE